MVSINGVGEDREGSKIIRSVAHAIISPELLKKFTWTGRSAPKVQKNSFSTKEKIIGLIYNTVNAYDTKYSRSNCDSDLKYRVCKHAHAHQK